MYLGCFSNMICFFLDKCGFVFGFIIVGMGGVIIIVVLIVNYLIEIYNVMIVFKIMGVVYIVVVIGCSFFICVVLVGYVLKGWILFVNNVVGMVNVFWMGMVWIVIFYLIFLMLGIGVFFGLMIVFNVFLIG